MLQRDFIKKRKVFSPVSPCEFEEKFIHFKIKKSCFHKISFCTYHCALICTFAVKLFFLFKSGFILGITCAFMLKNCAITS